MSLTPNSSQQFFLVVVSMLVQRVSMVHMLRISQGSYHGNVLSHSIAQGVRHCGGTVSLAAIDMLGWISTNLEQHFFCIPRKKVFIKTSATISMTQCSSLVGCAVDYENVWERRQQCFTTVAQRIDVLFQLLCSTRLSQVQCCLEFPSIGRKFRRVIPVG